MLQGMIDGLDLQIFLDRLLPTTSIGLEQFSKGKRTNDVVRVVVVRL